MDTVGSRSEEFLTCHNASPGYVRFIKMERIWKCRVRVGHCHRPEVTVAENAVSWGFRVIVQPERGMTLQPSLERQD